MTTIQRIRMTHQDYARLHHELAALRSRGSVEISDDFLDFDANRLRRQSERKARVRAIEALLTNAVVVSGEAVFDPVAKPGMILTIRYDDTGDTETFLLGRTGVNKAGIKVYSMASPLGRVISGARPGDQRFYAIPDETPRPVTLLRAVPSAMYTAKHTGPQSVPGAVNDCSMGAGPCPPA